MEEIKTLKTEKSSHPKELGIALGFPEDSADIRIAQYEADARKPRDEILAKMTKILMYQLISSRSGIIEPKNMRQPLFGCMN